MKEQSSDEEVDLVTSARVQQLPQRPRTSWRDRRRGVSLKGNGERRTSRSRRLATASMAAQTGQSKGDRQETIQGEQKEDAKRSVLLLAEVWVQGVELMRGRRRGRSRGRSRYDLQSLLEPSRQAVRVERGHDDNGRDVACTKSCEFRAVFEDVGDGRRISDRVRGLDDDDGGLGSGLETRDPRPT
eukprot:CAMPEP_0198656094 /NCGR_PEP_ID=MMETSP1467-20131203/8776_1 /TAXON_ID=1462469 /ORGANISM="unid. sp., Strain CCMP2135" /LENGTH=185 /DNA_ID=CAMNT_0044392109 /DNA_START=145 /DNA_END=700 /DNA_ORIENTATION=+